MFNQRLQTLEVPPIYSGFYVLNSYFRSLFKNSEHPYFYNFTYPEHKTYDFSKSPG